MKPDSLKLENQTTPTQPEKLTKKPAKPTLSPAIITPIVAVALIGLNLIAGVMLVNSSRQNQVILSHLEALNRNDQNLQQLETDLRSFSGKIAQLQGTLPREREIPEFIQFMSDSAAKYGANLNLNFTSDRPSQTKSKLFAIPLSLQTTITSKNLLLFITDVHNSKYQVRFDHLETNAADGTNSPMQIKLDATLYVASSFSSPN